MQPFLTFSESLNHTFIEFGLFSPVGPNFSKQIKGSFFFFYVAIVIIRFPFLNFILIC